MVSRHLAPVSEKRAALMPARFGEKKFGVAENAGERIV